MDSKTAYRNWISIYGLTDSGRMALGYTETSFGISIILKNGTVIPYAYDYDEYFYNRLLV